MLSRRLRIALDPIRDIYSCEKSQCTMKAIHQVPITKLDRYLSAFIPKKSRFIWRLVILSNGVGPLKLLKEASLISLRNKIPTRLKNVFQTIARGFV